MKRRFLSVFLLPVVAGPLAAGELLLEARPFDVIRSFDAAVMPDGACAYLQIVPETWKTFRLTSLADHGSKVSAGDVLASFDSREIDEWLADQRAEVAAREVALALAERNLRVLEETADARLEAAKRAARIAREENAYFKETRRKAEEESADQALKRAGWVLQNEQEELDQLRKMYEADDLTEETEEIILVRQKDAVEAAEFRLRMEKLDHRRTREVLLPREAVELAEAERESAVQAARKEKDIPETLEAARLEVAGLKRGLERERTRIREVERDRAMFEFKAPADGWFYHGHVADGVWNRGDLLKSLEPHGEPALRRPVATFVPADAGKSLVAYVDEAVARSLAADAKGLAHPPGLEDQAADVTVTRIGEAPGTDGRWRVDLEAAWPAGMDPAVGSLASVRVAAYHKDGAITVPDGALDFTAAGWTVAVKLADGKTQRRVVTRGRSNGTDTEITAGLEEGQVILVP